MNLYLDDDSSSGILVRLLRRDGHDVITSAGAGMLGRKDPAHLLKAIRLARIVLTHNYDDFYRLDDLVVGAGGHHPGILVARRDNDKTRDMKPPDIVTAIRNLATAG